MHGRDYTLAELIRFAERYIEDHFGVTDLTMIERAYLRHCVIKCAPSIEHAWTMYDLGQVSGRQVPSIGGEPAWLWLIELYGVDASYIQAEFDRAGGVVSPEFYRCLQLQRQRSHLP